MKKVFLTMSLVLGLALNAQAATKEESVKIAQRYSELVACLLPETISEYSVLEIDAGDSEYEKGDGSIHLVHWFGDTECRKGSGTVRSNYTVVQDTMGSGPVLVTKNMVDLGFGVNVLKEFTFKDGIVTIKGTVPGETKWDQKDVEYKLEHHWGDFKLIN